MSNTYKVDEKATLKVLARNFEKGETIKGSLTLLDKNEVELGKKEFDITVDSDFFARYEFVTKDIADELGLKLVDVKYVKGWMDSNGDGKYSRGYDQEVVMKIVECCKQTVPKIAITPGSWLYYEQRNSDYLTRASQCLNMEQTAPEYYLGYGKKYCQRFVVETKPKLSEDGKKWLERVLKRLQVYMEDGVVGLNMKSLHLGKDNLSDKIDDEYDGNEQEFLKGIECRSEDHRLFAFATHPDAYAPQEMKNLLCSDLIHIGLTPDIKEWHGFGENTWSHAGDTWSQAGTVASDMGVKSLGYIGVKCVGEGAKTATKSVVDGYEAVEEATLNAVNAIKNLF
jgi:hypothetical protein